MSSLDDSVVAALAAGPMSGRPLQQRLEAKLGRLVSFGTLSKVLGKLEGDEVLLITGRDQALRLGNRSFVTYELTARGRRRLDDINPGE